MNVTFTFPSGTVRIVNTLTLLAAVQHAEGMAKFGIPLARNAPTLKVLRETYEFDARTWKDAAPLLRRFYTAASRRNPRIHPCPTCGTENVLTHADVRHGYQCDRCADADEGIGPAY